MDGEVFQQEGNQTMSKCTWCTPATMVTCPQCGGTGRTLPPRPWRDHKGQFDFSTDWERMCVCGHKLGAHAAENETGKRPCFNEDTYMEGTTGEACSCEHFKLSRKKAQS